MDAEAAAALSAVGDADMLLMDGSLVPQPGDRPDEESDLFDRYEAVMADYRELYARAEAEDTALVGVVEDARSARFCRFLDEAGMDADAVSGGRDTVLLHHVLEPGERTCTVPYAAEPTPVLRDLEAGDSVYVFYLRTSRKDRPVRIEFYAAGEPGGRADAVASRVLSLCGSENAYGLPPVLLEADQRAALSRNEVEVVTKRIRTRLAHLPGTEELRRDRRPF
ncbi:MAG: DNA double-strand break repair nuclease NurA [Candidatus Nanohaloarchaea archaeon]|nr:DNA double-strand break repair nuclease NurA [Candidatus Nanohaloarchaea archaeon]